MCSRSWWLRLNYSIQNLTWSCYWWSIINCIIWITWWRHASYKIWNSKIGWSWTSALTCSSTSSRCCNCMNRWRRYNCCCTSWICSCRKCYKISICINIRTCYCVTTSQISTICWRCWDWTIFYNYSSCNCWRTSPISTIDSWYCSSRILCSRRRYRYSSISWCWLRNCKYYFIWNPMCWSCITKTGSVRNNLDMISLSRRKII